MRKSFTPPALENAAFKSGDEWAIKLEQTRRLRPEVRSLTAFTLIELVVVIMLVGIVVAGISSFLWELIENFKIVAYRQGISTQAKMALDSMVRDLREVYVDEDGSVLISYASSNRISFTNVDGQNITYVMAAEQILRNTSVVCDNVASFQLTYRDVNNNTLSPLPLSASDIQKIHHIIVGLTLVRGDEQYSLSSWVTLRNVRTR